MKSKRKWQELADGEWARVIRGVGFCEMCLARDKQLHAHHIIGRNKLAYRHDLSNGVCLCAWHHTLGAVSAHADKTFFYKWLRQNRKGQWKWFRAHTIQVVKKIGNTTVVTYSPIDAVHDGDEKEYLMLKEIQGQ